MYHLAYYSGEFLWRAPLAWCPWSSNA